MTAPRALVVCGTGGHAKVVADAARAQGWDVLGFASKSPKERDFRWRDVGVVSTSSEDLIRCCQDRSARFIAAIGDTKNRMSLFLRLTESGLEPATVIHPAATLSEGAIVGPGSMIAAGAVVSDETTIGQNAIINTAATLDHDNEVAAHVHISPGAHLGGDVEVGEGAHVGLGASVISGISIGQWSVIGAGCVVIKDVPEGAVLVGNPGRILRTVSPVG